MGSVSALEHALERLLHKRSLRVRLGDPGAHLALSRELGLSGDELEQLLAIPARALEDAAGQVLIAIRSRAHRGVGALDEIFPHAIAAWRSRSGDPDLDELFARFLDSDCFDAYREEPDASGERGACVEEAFGQFVDALELGSPEARALELKVALIKVLLLNPDPAFRLPAGVDRAPRGFFALATRPGGVELVAALDGKLVTGPISPALADILRGASCSDVAERHQLPDDVATALRAQLETMGLVGPSAPPPGAAA